MASMQTSNCTNLCCRTPTTLANRISFVTPITIAPEVVWNIGYEYHVTQPIIFFKGVHTKGLHRPFCKKIFIILQFVLYVLFF